MSPGYIEPPYNKLGNGQGCKCGAHRQHRVRQYMWTHPSASRKDCARDLKLSLTNVKGAVHLLYRRDLAKLCPECFKEQLFNGVCQSCGFEPFEPSPPIEIMRDSQSPTNSIHAGNLLGSETDYRSIRFENHGEILKRQMERGIEDSLVKAVKSDVENELKRTFPSEAITDEAGKLCVKEVLELYARWPGLVKSKKARKQCAENVMNRLRFLHPQLRQVTRLQVAEVKD